MSDTRTREVVGAIALYKSPDELLGGIDNARELGFTRFDVVSPYPIHGIDDVLGRRPSKLGYVALAAGLIGVALAKTTQWWMSAVDFPLNVGGKPLFSWPAFIPVTFEIMVLSAAVATVVAMLAVLNRLPQYSSGLLASKFMRGLTCDKFGLVVDAGDPKFDPNTVHTTLGGANVLGVDLLYRERPRMSSVVLAPRFLVLLLVVAVVSVGTARFLWKYAGEIPPMDFMKRQEKLNPQLTCAVFPDGLGMRPPVQGTVARGFLPYPFKVDTALGSAALTAAAEQAGANLVNPIPFTTENIERGRREFDIFCRPCHGPRAEGDGTISAAFPRPPSLHSAKVRGWPDGRIYHVITVGQNAMPSYSAQISRDDRWRIIQYVRALQRSRNAPERDLR